MLSIYIRNIGDRIVSMLRDGNCFNATRVPLRH